MAETLTPPVTWREVLCKTSDDIRAAGVDNITTTIGQYESMFTYYRAGVPVVRDHNYYPPGVDESCRHFVPDLGQES